MQVKTMLTEPKGGLQYCIQDPVVCRYMCCLCESLCVYMRVHCAVIGHVQARKLASLLPHLNAACSLGIDL